MPISNGPTRRLIGIVLGCLLALWVFSAALSRSSHVNSASSATNILQGPGGRPADALVKGHVIASKLGNETAKAELGRAAWKVLHTMVARFPEKPTADEQSALKSYVHLFQRLYPCGECAKHFGELLEEFPPQVSSRNVAAGWACHIHNKVNESLGKAVFDCSKIGDFYDCGCADGDEKEKDKKKETVDE